MIAQTIQLALAPVFVLVAIGNIMNILTNRLARVVDRSRVLQELYKTTTNEEHDQIVLDIRMVAQRIVLIGRAMRLMVLAGLAIGITVAILFFSEIAQYDLQLLAAGAFLLAIGLMMAALICFLRETQIATQTLRVPEQFLELDREI